MSKHIAIPVKDDWVKNLATFDLVDTAFIFAGLPLAIAGMGTFGLILAGIGYVFQTVLRKTPVLINLINLLDGLRDGDMEVMDAMISDLVPVLPPGGKVSESNHISTIASSPKNIVRLARPTDKVHIWIADVERDMP